MTQSELESTSTSNLRALRDWEDHAAWLRFREKYHPLLRRCCAGLELKGEDVEEVCQETWIEVAKRIRSFVYDPARHIPRLALESVSS